ADAWGALRLGSSERDWALETRRVLRRMLDRAPHFLFDVVVGTHGSHHAVRLDLPKRALLAVFVAHWAVVRILVVDGRTRWWPVHVVAEGNVLILTLVVLWHGVYSFPSS